MIVFYEKKDNNYRKLTEILNSKKVKFTEEFDLKEISDLKFTSFPVIKVEQSYMDFENSIKFLKGEYK